MGLKNKRVFGRLKWVKLICDHCGNVFSRGSVSSNSKCLRAAIGNGWDTSRHSREIFYCPDCVIEHDIVPSNDGEVNDTEPPVELADVEAIAESIAAVTATDEYGKAASVRMPFGKFKNTPLGSVRGDYLKWLLTLNDIHQDFRAKIIVVLKYRGDRIAR